MNGNCKECKDDHVAIIDDGLCVECYIEHTQNQLQAARDRIQQLQSVIDQYPKTNDGVAIYCGMIVWAVFRDGVFKGEVYAISKTMNRVEVSFDEEIEIMDEVKTTLLEPLTKCLFSNEHAANHAQYEANKGGVV